MLRLMVKVAIVDEAIDGEEEVGEEDVVEGGGDEVEEAEVAVEEAEEDLVVSVPPLSLSWLPLASNS